MSPETIPPSDPVWFIGLTPAERAELSSGRGELANTNPDVLIVGGGLIGLAIAYFLSEQGARVQLIEWQSLATGASGANIGGIWPNDQGPAHNTGFQAIAFLSRDLWGRLSLRPGFDFDWRVNGLLNVNTDRIGPSAAVVATALQEQGYAVQPVDGEQIANLEPHLRPGLTHGLHYPSEAHLHPVKAVASLARAARQAGACLSTGISATGVTIEGGKVTSVQTTSGRVAPGHVVAATGWTANWLAAALAMESGIDSNGKGAARVGGVVGAAHPAPESRILNPESTADRLKPVLQRLRPVSGQLISTERLPPLLNSAIVGPYVMVQLRSGEIVTGGNVLESDSLTPEPALSSQFADAARELIPALAGVPFTRAWCGLRPGTPDNLPYIDRAPAADNCWLACGHFKNGVLLAPATGKLLAEWITTGTRPEDLKAFGLGRIQP